MKISDIIYWFGLLIISAGGSLILKILISADSSQRAKRIAFSIFYIPLIGMVAFIGYVGGGSMVYFTVDLTKNHSLSLIQIFIILSAAIAFLIITSLFIIHMVIFLRRIIVKREEIVILKENDPGCDEYRKTYSTYINTTTKYGKLKAVIITMILSIIIWILFYTLSTIGGN